MDLLERAAQVFGNSPALKFPDTTISFKELDIQSLGIANILYEKGLRSGDIIAFVSPNTPEMVLLLAGVLKAGMIAAPLNNRFPEHILEATIENLSPQLLLTSDNQLLGLPGLLTLRISSVLESAVRNTSAKKFEFSESMERPVSIIHTSASSGAAKAVVHSCGNHWFSALGSNENIPFGNGDCWLLSLPLYHIGGYALLFRSLFSGGTLAVGEFGDGIADSMERFALTHISVVPTQLYRVLAEKKCRKKLRRLKAVLLGGSPATKSLIEDAIRQHIPLYLSYGSTEMSTQIATSPQPITSIEQNSGRILPYREILVAVDGELLVKGPCLFIGYYHQGKIQVQTDGDGWFHTADIGSVEENGTVTVVGRKDNMFISGGENIYPEETEKALMMIEGIRDALVVPAYDEEYGVRPVAYILTGEKNIPDDEAITRAMHALVGKLKAPVRYIRVSEWITLPGSQKIDRAWYRTKAQKS
ncbi:MAG: o-succinylbenzoate--CoA ligase [Chlorobium sp.]|jgi:o-succinylbenzoate---CoA ligase|nr:MAG: o-succinylbenzoate--CoA ligase [Chlorobium sp.]